MYLILAGVVAVLFCLLTVFLPFKHSGELVQKAKSLLKRRPRRAADIPLQTGLHHETPMRHLFQAWGVLATLLFVGISFWAGAWSDNEIEALSRVGQCALIAGALGGFLVFTSVAYWSMVPRALGGTHLERSGLKELWSVDLAAPQKKLLQAIQEHVGRSKKVLCLDVTGRKLIGRGPGATGGLLFDALRSRPDLPVCVLLFKPDSQAKDPERKVSSVFSTLLCEMEISREMYIQQLRETLEFIAALNQERTPEGQIQVRYYSEKPSFQVVLFDDSALTFPWQPREEKDLVPILELDQTPEGSAFYESYRRHFARLWGSPLQIQQGDTESPAVKDEEVERPWKAAGESSRNIKLMSLAS